MDRRREKHFCPGFRGTTPPANPPPSPDLLRPRQGHLLGGHLIRTRRPNQFGRPSIFGHHFPQLIPIGDPLFLGHLGERWAPLDHGLEAKSQLHPLVSYPNQVKHKTCNFYPNQVKHEMGKKKGGKFKTCEGGAPSWPDPRILWLTQIESNTKWVKS